MNISGSRERGVNENCLEDSARAPPFEEDCHVTTQRAPEETEKGGQTLTDFTAGETMRKDF